MCEYQKRKEVNFEEVYEEDAKNHKTSILRYAKSIKRTPVERLLTFINDSRFKIKYWDEETINGLIKLLKKEINYNGVKSPLLFKVSFNPKIKYSIASVFLKLFDFYMPFICNDGTLVQSNYVFFLEDIDYYYEDFFKDNYMDYYLSMNQPSRRNLLIYLHKKEINVDYLLDIEPDEELIKEFKNNSLLWNSKLEEYSPINLFSNLKEFYNFRLHKFTFDESNIDIFRDNIYEILIYSFLSGNKINIELRCKLSDDFKFKKLKEIDISEYLKYVEDFSYLDLINSLKALESTLFNIFELNRNSISFLVENFIDEFLEFDDDFSILSKVREIDLFNLVYRNKKKNYTTVNLFKSYIDILLKIYIKNNDVGLYFLEKTNFMDTIYVFNLNGLLENNKREILFDYIYPLIKIVNENKIDNVQDIVLLESLIYFISDFISMENMIKYTSKDKDKLIEMVNTSLLIISHSDKKINEHLLASIIERCYSIKSSSGLNTNLYNISIYSENIDYKLRVISELVNIFIEREKLYSAYAILQFQQIICRNLYTILIDNVLITNNDKMYSNIQLILKLLNKLSNRLLNEYSGLDDSYILILSVEFNNFLQNIFYNKSFYSNISNDWIKDNLITSIKLIGDKLYDYMNSLRHELVKTNYNTIRGFYYNEKLKNLPSIKKEMKPYFRYDTFFIDKISFYKECIEALIYLNDIKTSSLFISNYFENINTVHRIHPKSSLSLYETNYFIDLFPHLTISNGYKYLNEVIARDKKCLLHQILTQYPLLKEELVEFEENYGKEELTKILNKYFSVGIGSLVILKNKINNKDNITLINEYLNILEVIRYLYSLSKKMELNIDERLNFTILDEEIFNRSNNFEGVFKYIENKFKESKAKTFNISFYNSNDRYLSAKNLNSILDSYCLEKELNSFITQYNILSKVIKVNIIGCGDSLSDKVDSYSLVIEITKPKKFIKYPINNEKINKVGYICDIKNSLNNIKENIIDHFKTIDSEISILELKKERF